VQTRKLEMICPVCGSGEIFYTCTPNCCFNHVCNNCGSTFEPITRTTGRIHSGFQKPDPLPDASDPTVACAKCEATSVYMTSETLVCTACGSGLALEFTEVARGND
jgi:DNA-directed RNA polymerase subunit RPC12/RpoP